MTHRRGSHRTRLFGPTCLVVGALFAALPQAARAEAVEEFYRGRTLTMVTGVGPGGEYDIILRLAARHISRFIPGRPQIVVQNMVGASGMLMANWLARVAPRDATVIGLLQNSLPISQVVGLPGLQIDANAFGWIGSMSPTIEVLAAWHTSGIRTLEDARQRELIVGGVGAGGITNFFPKLINDLVGTKIRVIGGYQGGNELGLAIERGETGGRVMSWSTLKANKPDWLEQKKVNLLIAAGVRQADLVGVPRLEELVHNDADLRLVELIASGDALGRPFLTPPEAPPERLAALRDAFERMTGDAEFRREAGAVKIDVAPTSHTDLQRLVGRVLSTPKDVVERARRYF